MSIRLDALPALTSAIDQLAQLAANDGIEFTIADFGGTRTQADTTTILGYRDADYAVYVRNAQANGQTPVSIQRFRPIAPWGKSYHDFGAARDLAITAKPDGWSDGDAFTQLATYAPQLGLKWGGSFPNPDPDHFELDESLAQAAADWSAYTGGTNEPKSNLALGGASLGALLVLAAIALPLVVRAWRKH